MSPFFVLLAIFLAMACCVWKAVIVVPQGEPWVVRHSGRNVRELKPGLNLIKPFVERARPKSEFGEVSKP